MRCPHILPWNLLLEKAGSLWAWCLSRILTVKCVVIGFDLLHPGSLTLPPKKDGWKIALLLRWLIFRGGYVKLPGSIVFWCFLAFWPHSIDLICIDTTAKPGNVSDLCDILWWFLFQLYRCSERISIQYHTFGKCQLAAIMLVSKSSGRGWFATQTLEAGTMVLVERPLVTWWISDRNVMVKCGQPAKKKWAARLPYWIWSGECGPMLKLTLSWCYACERSRSWARMSLGQSAPVRTQLL